jgi:hypothetical protein
MSLGNLRSKGKRLMLIGAVTCLFAVSLSGCGGTAPMPTPANSGELYDMIGRYPGTSLPTIL